MSNEDLVKRLRHLVSLDRPENGGPYGGYAAEECMTTMREAADALSRPPIEGELVAQVARLILDHEHPDAWDRLRDDEYRTAQSERDYYLTVAAAIVPLVLEEGARRLESSLLLSDYPRDPETIRLAAACLRNLGRPT